MAYTIISQNNTTTTLQDENGNIIYVPGRVTLATSTDYTITEVNNNTATLTDGSGKVIRDVPCVVVLAGGGSSDTHNKGYYATPEALAEAEPIGEAGDWAIVGSTDTVWVWDEDSSAWVDSDQKGQVTSVNNQTGAVTLTASDVGALPSNTHIPADPVQADWSQVDSSALDYIKNKPTIPAAQVNSDWNANSGVAQILNKPTIPDAIQTGTMPTASADELGKVYQFIGTTDANYTHGYFYECVSDGGNPATYSWSNVQVQASSGGLPSQTGQSGKFLTTDGTDASWATVNALKNTATGSFSMTINGTASTNNYATNIGRLSSTSGDSCVVVGDSAKGASLSAVFGYKAEGGTAGVAIGSTAKATGGNAIAIGQYATASGNYSIALGYSAYNTTAKTMAVCFDGNVSYRLLDSDGTIPTDRFSGRNTTPSADGTYVPTLTISSGVATRSWGAAASAPVVPATTPTLAVADWSSNTQTITVSGVTSSNVVLVGPAPSSAQDYADAGILCTAQGTDSLTFTCATVPSNAITLSVVIFG